MTIAACYVSPEGVVLGADSTSTYATSDGHHHFNYGQKLFEIGENSTLGVVTWGLGGLQLGSYRTLIARLADSLKTTPAQSVLEVATRWVDVVWPAYSLSLAGQIQACRLLAAKQPYDPRVNPPPPDARTEAEEKQFKQLKETFVVGFCIAGYIPADRIPGAFEIVFDPLLGKPTPVQLPPAQSFWGMPALITRLIKGCGDEVRDGILASGKWTGTPQDLDVLVQKYSLNHPSTVPIREAIDFTHACLLTTIKAMKFSPRPRLCGGPIELAVITTDRLFRWVQHKGWDTALRESEP